MRGTYDEACALADARAAHVAQLCAAPLGAIRVCSDCGGDGHCEDQYDRWTCRPCCGTGSVVAGAPIAAEHAA